MLFEAEKAVRNVCAKGGSSQASWLASGVSLAQGKSAGSGCAFGREAPPKHLAAVGQAWLYLADHGSSPLIENLLREIYRLWGQSECD